MIVFKRLGLAGTAGQILCSNQFFENLAKGFMQAFVMSSQLSSILI